MGTFARIELGMRTAEFLQYTGRQWNSLVEHHERMLHCREYPVELMVGQLIAMVANASGKWDEPRAPKEFMPSEWRKEAAAKPVAAIATNEALDRMRSTMRILGGAPAAKSV
jgi:hypothetical protein